MRFLLNKQCVRLLHSKPKHPPEVVERLSIFLNTLDWKQVEKSLLLRQQNNNVTHLRKLVENLHSANCYELMKLEKEVLRLPNYVHPRIWNYANNAKELFRSTPDRKSVSISVEFSELCKQMNIFRMDHLGNYTGHKSYYLLGQLAQLEHALVQYSIAELKKHNFHLLSVPDILPKEVIEGCGMQTEGDRTQVYKLETGSCLSGTSEMALAGFFANRTLKEIDLPQKFAAVYKLETGSCLSGTSEMALAGFFANRTLKEIDLPQKFAAVYKLETGSCLSGTSEMALAGFFANRTLKEIDLPQKFAAVSRCFRAETSGLNEEKGIYRVHQFTKVEMFSVCSRNQSEDMVELFKNLEMKIFRNLNLNFRLLDMPPTELGAPAYQKYDIETWMPGREIWGEISSCSNCIDYQAKRLNIRYIANNGEVHHTHTVNGTVAAIPRLLISLIESNQIDGNTVEIPDALRYFMGSREIIKEKSIPEIKLVKYLKSNI